MQSAVDAETQLQALNENGRLLLANMTAQIKIQICTLAAESYMRLHM